MYITKTKYNTFIPSSDKDLEEMKSIPVGAELKTSVARNPKFHRKGMALLNIGFENQDRYDNFEVYRKIITIKAGYYDLAPTKDGEPYYLPKSLSYENMSAADFEKWFNDTLSIICKETETAPEQIKAELAGFY